MRRHSPYDLAMEARARATPSPTDRRQAFLVAALTGRPIRDAAREAGLSERAARNYLAEHNLHGGRHKAFLKGMLIAGYLLSGLTPKQIAWELRIHPDGVHRVIRFYKEKAGMEFKDE